MQVEMSSKTKVWRLMKSQRQRKELGAPGIWMSFKVIGPDKEEKSLRQS